MQHEEKKRKINTGLISVKLINGIKSDEDQQSMETASINHR